jgi:hypothetical protein
MRLKKSSKLGNAPPPMSGGRAKIYANDPLTDMGLACRWLQATNEYCYALNLLRRFKINRPGTADARRY